MGKNQDREKHAPLPPGFDLQKALGYAEKHARPWGHYRVLDQGPGFLVKAILVKPRSKLSLQTHALREEAWTGAMGTARVSVGGVKMLLRPGETVRIPVGVEHRLENPGDEPVVVVEVAVGAEIREDDIVRLVDDYGRATPDGGVVAGSPSAYIGPDNPERVVPLEEGRPEIRPGLEPHPGARNP